MTTSTQPMQQALVASLYAESLILADEARSWFDFALDSGRAERPGAALGLAESGDDATALFRWAGRHDPSLRIALSCESLRLTTRLMHVIAWLLLQRAIAAGEVAASVSLEPTNRLGPSPAGDLTLRDQLPAEAQRLIDASESLYRRVAQLDCALDQPAGAGVAPVHALFDRLQQTL